MRAPRRRRPHVALAGVTASALVLVACAPASSAPDVPFADARAGATLQAHVADAVTAVGISDGDLWPTCWADDDALYAANGDGAGFGNEFSEKHGMRNRFQRFRVVTPRVMRPLTSARRLPDAHRRTARG